jgi:uncharacterized protein (TIGR03437 family)
MLAPANYAVGGRQYLVATFASDGGYVLDTATAASFGLKGRPARPGDVIIAYGIGFGDVTPAIASGVIVGGSNTLANPITFSFGGVNAALSYAGLAAGFIGLYEFYVIVPQGLGTGDSSVTVMQDGVKIPQSLYLAVQN